MVKNMPQLFKKNSHPRTCLLILERGEGRKKGRETLVAAYTHAPQPGTKPGIELGAFWFMGWHFNQPCHTCQSSFSQPSTDGHLGCFQILAVVGVHPFGVSGFFGHIPRSRITGSKGSSIFNFVSKHHTAFYWCSLHSHQQRALGFPFLHILTNTCCLLTYW